MPLKPGQVLNKRYRIDSRLGQGGAGTVYKAWDRHLERPRALKENLETSPEAQRQFKREAQMLADLRHPNLPRVIDHFLIPGQGQYLVMEYVEGEDLHSLVQRTGPLPQAHALAWISQVCDAVAYLHHLDPPVIHRDIKPANIRVTPAGTVMLVDFGIAKTYDPARPTTLAARALSIGYAPPEQYGQGATDTQSDIYALGATLYTLLTGQVPGDSLDSLLGRAAPLPPAHTVNPQVSRGVSAAIGYAMQLEKSRRYPTVEAFQTALTVGAMGGPVEPPRLDRRSLSTKPVPYIDDQAPENDRPDYPDVDRVEDTQPADSWSSPPVGQENELPAYDRESVYSRPGIPPPTSKMPWTEAGARPRARLSGVLLWLGGGIVLALGLCLLAGMFLWRTFGSAAPVRVASQLPPATSPAEPRLPATGTAGASATAAGTATAPGGIVTLTATPPEAAWQQGRLAWLQQQSGGHGLYFQPLAAQAGGSADPNLVFSSTGSDLLLAPLWSPNGSRIVLYNRNGDLMVVEAAAGAAPRSMGNCVFPSWSGDGTTIGCSAAGGRTYQLLDAASGAVIDSVPLPSNVWLPVLSPVQNEIAYSVREASGATSLWRMGLDGTPPVLLAGEASENYAPAWSPDGQQIAYQSNEDGGPSEIWVVSRDGNRRQITRTANGWSRAPSWSPDGQWLAFVSSQAGSTGADYGEIFVVSLASGEVLQVSQSGGRIYDWRVAWGR